jgi:FeS assembly SUF system regulator
MVLKLSQFWIAAMLRISKLTDYGTMVLACLAARPGDRHTATAIAERTRLGQPTVSKLLKSFHRAGLVNSVRGARGGYQLARPASGISAAAIIDAIEGPVAITECSGDHSACDLASICSTGSAWQTVNLAIRRSLDELSLAQLSGQEAVLAWRPELSRGAARATPLGRAGRS